MSFMSRLIPGYDPRRRRELNERIAGENSQANLAFGRARGAAAGVAGATAARAADQGLNVAAANRLASQGEQQAVAQAAQQQAAGRAAEVQQAENELASMREQRSAFMRNLLGQGLQTAGGIAAQLGIGSPEGGAGGAAQTAATMAGGPLAGAAVGAASPFLQRLLGQEPATATVDRALGYQPAVSDAQLLAAAPVATAAPAAPGRDPLAGFVLPPPTMSAPPAASLGQGIAGDLTARLVPPQGVVPGTPEYLEWLRSQRGGG